MDLGLQGRGGKEVQVEHDFFKKRILLSLPVMSPPPPKGLDYKYIQENAEALKDVIT